MRTEKLGAISLNLLFSPREKKQEVVAIASAKGNNVMR